MNIRVTGIFSKETPMFDIPDEYIASTSTFTKEEFTEFLRQKQIYTYDGYGGLELDWWRFSPKTYKNTWYDWETDEWIEKGLAEAMQGDIVYLTVYNNSAKQVTLLQMYYEAFVMFSNDLAVALSPWNFGVAYCVFNESFETMGFYNADTYCLHTNFPLFDGDVPLDPPAAWKQRFNITNIEELQTAIREHERDEISDAMLWTELKNVIIDYHTRGDYVMLEKLYACIDLPGNPWMTGSLALWEFFDDLRSWYVSKDRYTGKSVQGGARAHVLRYVSKFNLWAKDIAEDEGDAKRSWNDDNPDYACQCLYSKTPTDWEGALTILFCNFENYKEKISNVLTLVSNCIEKVKISLKFGYEEFYIRQIATMELHQHAVMVTLINDPENIQYNLLELAHSMAHQSKPCKKSLLRTDPVEWFCHYSQKLRGLRKLSITDEYWKPVIKSTAGCKHLLELNIDNKLDVSDKVLADIESFRPRLNIALV